MLFLYEDISWGFNTTSVGFNTDVYGFNLLDVYDNLSILALDSSSNVGIPGAYYFRVDQDRVVLPAGSKYSYNHKAVS